MVVMKFAVQVRAALERDAHVVKQAGIGMQ